MIIKLGLVDDSHMIREYFVVFYTVNEHLKRIYKKLNINSKSELISYITRA